MFPRFWVRPLPLNHVNSVSQTQSKVTLPQYICLDSGDFASSASPSELCPWIIPHSSQSDFPAPLDVGSVPDLGTSSAFASLPKDTILAPVSCFIVLVSIPAAQWVLSPYATEDEHMVLAFSVVIIRVCVLPVEKAKLHVTRFSQISSVCVNTELHLQLEPLPVLLAPQRPAPIPIFFMRLQRVLTSVFMWCLLIFSLFFRTLLTLLLAICLHLIQPINDYKLREDGHVWWMSRTLPFMPKALYPFFTSTKASFALSNHFFAFWCY